MRAVRRNLARFLLILLFLQNVASQAAQSYQVTINPRTALSLIRAPNKPLQIMCTASQGGRPVPLSGCQFYQSSVILDFSQGHSSIQHPEYMYQGAGLNKGECGAVLRKSRNWGNVMIGCRVRAASGGGWKYAAMVLDVSNFVRMKFDLQGPRQIVVLPGTNVNLLGNSDLPLDRCRIHLSDTYWLDFNQGPASAIANNLRYNGAGLPEKECGVAMTSVTPEMSGFVRVNVKSPAPDPDEQAFRGTDYVTLIVATPPERPILTLASNNYNDGDNLLATCVVLNSRPVSNITWFIGGNVVRQDTINDAPLESQWHWEYEPQTIVQNLTYRITSKDDGKEIKCQAGHLALPGGILDSEKVVIRVGGETVVNRVQDMSSYDLTISPRTALNLIRAPKNTFQVMCKASQDGRPVPLSGCQFYQGSVILDFSQGHSSVQHPEYMYHGAGLDKGECGAVLGGSRNWGNFMIGCRVRAARGGGWKYNAMVLDVSNFLRMNYTIQGPREIVVLPGTDVILLGDGNLPLDRCRVHLSDTFWLDFNQGPASPVSNNLMYYGAGLPEKQCGIAMSSVTSQMSGFVRINVKSPAPDPDEKAFRGVDYVTLIVATPPEPPHLTLATQLYKDGDTLVATCSVANSRPVSNITWFIGGTVVRQNSINEAPLEAQWRWEHEPQTIVQNLAHKLTAKDNGKEVKCRAGHFALPGGFMDSEKITIRFGTPNSCQPNPCGPDSICQVMGGTPRCSCKPDFVGSPPSCRPECVANSECSTHMSCINQKCKDVCPGICGAGANCHVDDHRPICSCPRGYIGDPFVLCEEDCPITGSTIGPEVTLPPRLQLTFSGSNKDELQASCIVRQCSVVANVTWYLGEELLQYHFINESPEDADETLGRSSITLDLGRRRLNFRDNGKELKCQVAYFGIEEPQTTKSVIYVKCPQLYPSHTASVAVPPELYMNKTRYTEGDSLKATCIVRQCLVIDSVAWYLGDKLLEFNSIKESIENGSDMIEMRPFTQQLGRKILNWRDNGKDLICQVTYFGVSAPQRAKQMVNVEFKDAVDISNHTNLPMINPKMCGQEPIDVKIFNGRNAQLFEYPWMVILILNAYANYPDILCGASVINRKYVLTAAHCVEDPYRVPQANLWRCSVSYHNINPVELSGIE